ncbi:hypothetical protein WR25_21493 [Diploscapter pachys]|uniref:Uncharacterized protein n=1 Tax=Diploscapter pachys TaxID=2018661 RepID=A0A2A2LXT2_9BILA|nr:hypothetical protein WR25_21493 [Diploscapter pachys]
MAIVLPFKDVQIMSTRAMPLEPRIVIGGNASGIVLIFLGLWMPLDPKRNYILDLVHFSEDDPLLWFASVTALVTGIATLLVGFLGCCGALRRMRCLLVGFILSLVAIFLADVAIATLALVYRNKFTDDRMQVYLTNLTQNRYNRDYWVKPLMDTVQFYTHLQTSLRKMVKYSYGADLSSNENVSITLMIDKLQFYEECCGAHSPDDYLGSRWAAALASNIIYETEDRPIVPDSCCKQLQGASALNPHPKSAARCQQIGAHPLWRNNVQSCCGGTGPKDYENSFWYITNTLRGTRSFVPPSCCKQTQQARAWSIQPVDPMCTTYFYDTQVFNSAVYNDGCYEKLQKWFNEQTIIFTGIGFGFAMFIVIPLDRIRCVYYEKQDYEHWKKHWWGFKKWGMGLSSVWWACDMGRNWHGKETNYYNVALDIGDWPKKGFSVKNFDHFLVEAKSALSKTATFEDHLPF